MDETLLALAIDALVVTVWSVTVALAVARIPSRAFAGDGSRRPMRDWERRLYERVGIRRWKDHLPDAGAIFAGGRKRHLPGATPGALSRFGAETRRAELVHWMSAAAGVAFPLWGPLPLAVVAAVVWVAGNLPFIAVQRFNRARIAHVLAATGARPDGAVLVQLPANARVDASDEGA